jgi:broad specificity phosphatase PhoE
MSSFWNLPMDLVIVRHGQSEANVMADMNKRGDTEARAAMAAAKRHDSNMRLTDLGRQQARTVGAWLREHGPTFDAFYVSEYIRTKETAGEMDLQGAVWQPDLMIRERDQGVQDGGGDVKLGLDPEEQFRLDKSPLFWCPLGGESMADVVIRIRHFLETLSSCAAGMRVCVVCHYRTIHAFRMLLEDIPMEHCPDLLKTKMPNCCVWWYSRRDHESGETTPHLSSVRRIAVSVDRASGERVVDEQKWAVRRVTFSSAALLEQVRRIPQVINNGPEGAGEVVEGVADAAASTPRHDGGLPESKRRRT